MFIKKDGYYEIEEFSKLGINTVYTTLEFGDSRELKKSISYELDIRDRLNLKDRTIVYTQQTHSTNIAIIRDKVEDLYLDTDGFITARKDLVLFTQYADCLPIYAYDKKNEVIAMCHAGWKGAFNGIQTNLIKKMISEYDSKVEDILIGLGIGISIEKYPVEANFFELYLQRYGKYITNECFKIIDNRYHYDNIKFNKSILLNFGIKEENIVISNKCTYQDEFNSYRRDKEKSNRNGGFIFFKKV